MIINLLANNGYIVLNKTLMKKIGLYEAILIGELASEQIYWRKRNELIDGFFFSTQKGMPLRTWYTINQDLLIKSVSKTIEKSSSQKIEHQEVKNFHNKSSNFLTPCCENNERYDVKKFNINNNNNIYYQK